MCILFSLSYGLTINYFLSNDHWLSFRQWRTHQQESTHQGSLHRQDAINPAHGSLLRVNSPSHEIFSNREFNREDEREEGWLAVFTSRSYQRSHSLDSVQRKRTLEGERLCRRFTIHHLTVILFLLDRNVRKKNPERWSNREGWPVQDGDGNSFSYQRCIMNR